VALRRVALASTTVALTACSLFSGWGGLEGGGCRNCDGGSTDGLVAPGDGSNPVEATSDVLTVPDHVEASPSSEAGPATIECGATACDIAAGQGCCIQGGASGTCTQSTVCATTGFFLACDSSSQCAGGQVCCFDIGVTNGSQCESTCAGAILCSPGVQGDCPGAKPNCVAATLPPGYHSCQ